MLSSILSKTFSHWKESFRSQREVVEIVTLYDETVTISSLIFHVPIPMRVEILLFGIKT